MRVATRCQQRLDCTPVSQVELNTQCRHEIVPFLRALQHIYGKRKLREELLELIAKDVNPQSSADRGREGLDGILIRPPSRARIHWRRS